MLDDIFRNISSAMSSGTKQVFLSIDSAVYSLFNKVFELFFDISKSKFLTGDIYSTIFRRVFLIIGIFMLFKLTFSFLSYLISPDSINDPHNPGNMNKLVGRVIASFLFLIILVPIGSGNDTPYSQNSSGLSENVQEQGILFGTLQSVQDAILDENNNVLGKLILGNNASTVENGINNIGNNISTTVFSSFFQVNRDALDTTNHGDYYDGTCTYNGNVTKVSYNYKVSNFNDAKNLINVVCTNSGKELFTYDVFISTIVGLIIDVLVFLFTFDVALRSIKLGILRLIAPIPAISYISPKSAKDGAFANYTKILMSTYLDIFLRVALIYLVVLLISHVSSPDSQIIGYSSGTSGIGKVIIIISLLFFAVQAPKFIMQALGIKSKGTGLGFGAGLLGGALGGAIAGGSAGGILGALGGALGGAASGAGNYNQAAAGQRPNMSAWQAARNRGAQIGSGDPNAKPMNGLMSFTDRLRNRGVNSRSVSGAKDDMYALQNKVRSAQNDFTSNTANLMHGTASNGMSWQDYANQLRSDVITKQSNVSDLKNQKSTLQNMLSNPSLDPADRSRIMGDLVNIDRDIDTAEAELTTAQNAQQAGFSEYHDAVSIAAGKAESKYKAGDAIVSRFSARHNRRKARDDRNKYR